jgi:hypothetical protein
VADLNFVESEAIVEELEHIRKDPKKWEEFVAAKPKGAWSSTRPECRTL